MRKGMWVGLILRIFVVLPVWWYLLYKILERVEASELMWFLFWIYMPVVALVAVLESVTKEVKP